MLFIITIYIFGFFFSGICSEFKTDAIPSPSFGVNGDTWNKLDKVTKFFYIVGYNDGYGLGFAIRALYKHKGPEEIKIEDIWIKNAKSMEKADKEQIIEGIDQFYSDFANRKIPVCLAYDFVMRKIRGESEKDIQKAIEEARATFSKIE